MFIKHNNVTLPCPFDSGGNSLRSFGYSSLLRAFLPLKKRRIPTTSESRQWLQFNIQKLINQPLRVKELRATLNQTINTLLSGGFGFYKLTGEV